MNEPPSPSLKKTAPAPPVAITTTRLILLGIAVRLVIDTGIQIFGPYLSQIAAGLGISIVTLGALNSLRSLMGLAGPGFGSLAASWGYRPTMRFQLLLGAAGVFIFSFSSNVWMAAVGMILMGLGIFSIAPILQAYMSAHIPYEKRARGLGTVEYAWALAGILGLSVAGLLIERFGWRAPFWLIGAGLLVAFVMFRVLPASQHKRDRAQAKQKQLSWQSWLAQMRDLPRLEQNARSAWGAIIAGALSVFAISNVSIIFGTWLGREYGLTTAQLGLVALTLGLADLAGAMFVSRYGDRVGKYRVVLGSMAGAVVAYLMLPVLNFQLLTAVIGLVMTRFFFEAGIVGNISLLSEQVPKGRAKVLTLASAAVTLGVAVASLTGPLAYSTWGVLGLGLISAASVLAATLIIFRLVSEGRTPGPESTANSEVERRTMPEIIETEWSGYHEDKDTLRSEIWRRLKEQGVSPREPFGHIPSFAGAEEAANLLADLPIWQNARVIKSNPDTAHAPLRQRALQDGKRLYMAVPRLTEERCFVELTAQALAGRGVSPEEAAAWLGAMAHGRLVSPDEMEPIDLVLVGCVAVSRRGGRIGKGAGFADLELGILSELGLIGPETPVVAAVHPLQIVDAAALPLQPHDWPLDWIITPAEVFATNTAYPRPGGLDWDQIRAEQYESIPILSALRARLSGSA